jgi:hypothetical protein
MLSAMAALSDSQVSASGMVICIYLKLHLIIGETTNLKNPYSSA